MGNKHRTRKSASKRFKITKTGKVLHRSQNLRHLRRNKSKKQIRSLKTMKPVMGKYKNKVKKMMGKA